MRFSYSIPAAICLLALPLFSQSAPVSPSPALEKLKTLAGTWRAKGMGKSGKVTNTEFAILSKGNCLQEDMNEDTLEWMLTLYCADSEGILMTHYCAAGNQPRMKAANWTGDTLAFEYLDAGNLASPDEGHMHKLVILIKDKRHFSATWTYRDHGKDVSDSFEYTRVK